MSQLKLKLNSPTNPTDTKTINANGRQTLTLGPNNAAGSAGQVHYSGTAPLKLSAIGLTAADFKRPSEIEHVLQRPDLYIGSTAQEEVTSRAFDINTQIMERLKNKSPAGLLQLFNELLTNAADNAQRTRRAGYPPGDIMITIDDTKVTCKNFGLPVPIELHKETGLMIPEFVFGNLRAGSNYTDVRTEAGMNAIGIKAVNIHSTLFTIDLYDSIRGKTYRQEWTNNMSKIGQAVIGTASRDNKMSSTEVSYVADLSRFGYAGSTLNLNGSAMPAARIPAKYPPEFVKLAAALCAHTSFNSKVRIHFTQIVNGISKSLLMDYLHPFAYASLYFPGKVSPKTALVHYEWPVGSKVREYKDGHQESENWITLPTVEMIILDTPSAGISIGFVNSLYTVNGGVHVTAAYNAVANELLETINGSISNKQQKSKGTSRGKGLKGGPGKGKPVVKEIKDKKDGPKLTQRDVTMHLSIIVSVRVENPRFNSQSKDQLKAPKPSYDISKDDLEQINDWQLPKLLFNALRAKEIRTTSTHERRNEDTFNPKAVKAVNSKYPNERAKCTLFIVEGLSAMGYARNLISALGGRSYYGALPMKGKVLNVLNASSEQINNNKELNGLKSFLGLRDFADYTKAEERGNLKYGRVVLAADADDDGWHILGLLLLNFFHRYSGLIENGYVQYLVTPRIRASRGASKLSFYTKASYQKWIEEGKTNGWSVKYFKGLGKSKIDDVKDDAKLFNQHKITFIADLKAKESIDLAFHDEKVFTDKRKKWILQYHEEQNLILPNTRTISDFVNYDLIQYSVASVIRSIPDYLCGLKPAQIKLIWSAILKWNIHKKSNDYKEEKLTAFATFAAGKTQYHHAPNILSETAINMAQRYVGANNLPYFCDDGQYGTREAAGHDAADPRYLGISPEWWLKYIFRKEDMPLLESEQQIIENEKSEPRRLYPIIPMHMINGASGIGTGSSTTIPCHNPIDIVNWLRCRLRATKTPTLMPWYRGFRGTIRIYDNRKHSKAETVEQMEARQARVILKLKAATKDVSKEDLKHSNGVDVKSVQTESVNEFNGVKNKRYCAIFTGIYRVDDDGVVHIDELPIGRSMERYKDKTLNTLMSIGTIDDYDDFTQNDSPYFMVYGMKAPTLRDLKLTTSISFMNMILIGKDDKPCQFGSVDEIMEKFYIDRLEVYRRRKARELHDLLIILKECRDRRKVIAMAQSGEIKLLNHDPEAMTKKLAEHDIDYKAIVNKITVNSLSTQKIQALEQEIETIEKRYKALQDQSVESIWDSELEEFINEYGRRQGAELAHRNPTGTHGMSSNGAVSTGSGGAVTLKIASSSMGTHEMGRIQLVTKPSGSPQLVITPTVKS
jgi:DNA topoisomerase-2